MVHIKSDKELLIELRNKIAGRLIEVKANISYWQIILRKAKKNSQEMVDVLKNIEINESSVKKDNVFLRCIDLMIKKEK
jgi:hypothetical protein